MRCTACGAQESRVIDSRLINEGRAIRRRRQCTSCGRRFTTYERIQDFTPLVVKKDLRREPYSRDKIMGGLAKACEKRPVALVDLEALIEDVEKSLFELVDEEVESSRLGEEVMLRLKDIDQVAYIRFASVYRSFKDVGEFMEELRELVGSSGASGPDSGTE